MLSYIYKLDWASDLTKYIKTSSYLIYLNFRDLCTYIEKVINKKEILDCHSPILTCVLLSEFLKSISDINVQNAARIDKTIKNLMDLSCKIQSANPNENYIKFLMTQKDSRGRTTFHIASDQSFYRILESPEVGTIVNKMWEGKTSAIGVLGASSINNFLIGNNKSLNPMDEFKRLDEGRVYSFQLDVWTDSCSLRYWPESFSTIILIMVYNLFIFFIVEDRLVITPFFELSFFLQLLGYVYIAWVCTINISILSQFYFCKWSARSFSVTGWQILEIIMMLSSFLILFDVQIVLGKSDGTNDIPYLVRACVLALNDLLVWLRITGILLTWKDFGPLIRMIYLMGIMLLKNLVIYAMWVICCGCIYNCLFYKDNPLGFGSYSITVTNLVGMFINNFTMFEFNQHPYLGSVMVTIFVTFSGIILINLLIASLSNVYNELSKVVDASHRSVLIGYYRRYKWDSENGYLIFLCSPLNILNLCILPFTCCIKAENKNKLKIRRKEFNKRVCKVLYLIYFFPIFISLLAYSLIIIPFTYIKGLISSVIYNWKRNDTCSVRFCSVCFWFFCGIFYLFSYIWPRDLIHVIKIIYKKVDVKVNEIERMKKFIKPVDVIIFLKYIHNMKTTDINDLHYIFMNYLEFEYEEKAKIDDAVRQNKNYMETIKKAMGQNQKSSAFLGSIMMMSNRTTIKSKTEMMEEEEEAQANPEINESSVIINSYIKKNLIIIEILENFLIADGTDNRIVDIEKMQRLLPKSRNINQQYIKRLIYTNITSLNKALNTIKKGKNELLRGMALKKILLSAESIDASIDNEISLKKGIKMEEVVDEYGKIRGQTIHDPLMELEFYSDLFKFMEKITADVKFLKDSEDKERREELEREAEEQREKERQEKLEQEKKEKAEREEGLHLFESEKLQSKKSNNQIVNEIKEKQDDDDKEEASLREYNEKHNEDEKHVSFAEY